MSEPAKGRKFSGRAFVSLTLTLICLLLILSAGVLYAAPRGRVANWGYWSFLGLTRHQWVALHINVGTSFIILGVVHVIYNFVRFLGYLKRKLLAIPALSPEILLALVLSAGVVLGTGQNWPPFSTLAAWNEALKDRWEGRLPAGPIPHAEALPLTELAGQLGISSDQLLAALAEEGFPDATREQTLATVAKNHGTVPGEIFRKLQQHLPSSSLPPRGGRGPGWGRQGGGQGPGMGFGRGGGRGRFHQEQSEPQTHTPEN